LLITFKFSALLADNFQKSFSDLETGLQDAFGRYGITEQDWDGFRKQSPLMLRGAPYADMTQEGGVKFHQMVLSETDFAVPKGSCCNHHGNVTRHCIWHGYPNSHAT
jgi:hypothetical protein